MLQEMFEKTEKEFLQFDQIPEAELRHRRPDLCGMLYLDEKVGGTHDMLAGSEHDEVFLDISSQKAETLLVEADVVYLQRCGIRYEEESGFCMFV